MTGSKYRARLIAHGSACPRHSPLTFGSVSSKRVRNTADLRGTRRAVRGGPRQRERASRVLRLARETGSVEPAPHTGGTPRRVTEAGHAVLVELLRARPDATL